MPFETRITLVLVLLSPFSLTGCDGCRSTAEPIVQPASSPAPAEATPSLNAVENVVLIILETLRPDRTSMYGYQRETTPRLDAFFGGGVFERARSTAPCTRPSVRQFMAGRFDGQGATLAEVVSANGKETAAIISQQVLWRPLFRRGYDHWDMQGPDEVDHLGMSARLAAEVTDHALAWLQQRRSEKREGGFFLWLHYFDPHDPYNPPESARRFGRDVKTYRDGDRRTAQRAARKSGLTSSRVYDIFSDGDIDALNRLYDDEIRYADAEIGRLLDGFQGHGYLADTAFIFSSDHGERLGEHGQWDHCYTVHDLEIAVPFALRLPPAFDAKLPLTDLVSTIDIFPTVTALFGMKPTKRLDGESLVAGPLKRKAVAAFYRRIGAIATHDWKLYCNVGDSGCRDAKLYRLVGGGERGAQRIEPGREKEQVRRLKLLLRQSNLDLRHTLRMTDEDLEQLKAIGYTE